MKRPTKIKNTDDLLNYYWLKSELADFCRKNRLSTHGIKAELIERIQSFLKNGTVDKVKLSKSTLPRDSDNKITRSTPVINYNNDAATREFFTEQIGKQFKFNAYLRQFTNTKLIKPGMTYGDLIDGWIAYEKDKKTPGHKKEIDKQFEYNQFIRDYFAQHKGHPLSKAIAAWKFVKTRSGPNTYAYFRKIKKM